MTALSAQAIDAILPQTQCRECNYDACLPYAEAIVNHQENIGLCAPGGEATLKAIASLVNTSPNAYLAYVKQHYRSPKTAKIREDACIGCTKCIKACPVDCIIGSGKLMHSIVTDECTGCGLCVEPCPVDCIDIIDVAEPLYQPEKARERFKAKQARDLNHKKQKRLKKQALDSANVKSNIAAILARTKNKSSATANS